ncbi:MAG: FAD-dependent thymidylate synthase [Synergistales bacterium]|nr:FAD-dependent thymidylate synthase [Synergistales bacterium]
MNVSLLVSTPCPQSVIWTAARVCKSGNKVREIWSDSLGSSDKKDRLIKACWKAGHYSVFEHVNVTFAISEISRACLAQLSRHRFLSMSVQSQRHVIPDLWRPLRMATGDLSGPVDYLPPTVKGEAREVYLDTWAEVCKGCGRLSDLGVPQEDVRYLYPEGTTTNLVLTCNLRTLGELNEKRAQNNAAQWEIRELVQNMVDLVVGDFPWFGECLGGREKDEDQDQASTGNEAV